MLTLLVNLSLLIVCGLASDAPYGSAYIPLPAQLPINFVADPLLDTLYNEVVVAEARETAAIEGLEILNREADVNVEFANNFRKHIYPKFKYHQEKQNGRLDALEDMVAEIRALRQKVQDLSAEEQRIDGYLDKVFYPGRKSILFYAIDDLQNADLERIARISEMKQRADAVNGRIDVLFEKICKNAEDLCIVQLQVTDATVSTNRQKGSGDRRLLKPNDPYENTGEHIFDDYDGVPMGFQITLAGFHIVKHQNYEGFPSIYIGRSVTVDNEGYQVQAYDMSSGGWFAEYLYIAEGNVFYDTIHRGLK